MWWVNNKQKLLQAHVYTEAMPTSDCWCDQSDLLIAKEGLSPGFISMLYYLSIWLVRGAMRWSIVISIMTIQLHSVNVDTWTDIPLRAWLTWHLYGLAQSHPSYNSENCSCNFHIIMVKHKPTCFWLLKSEKCIYSCRWYFVISTYGQTQADMLSDYWRVRNAYTQMIFYRQLSSVNSLTISVGLAPGTQSPCCLHWWENQLGDGVLNKTSWQTACLVPILHVMGLWSQWAWGGWIYQCSWCLQTWGCKHIL